MRISTFGIVIACCLLLACDTYSPYPRPFGFPRIDLPKKTAYETFSNTSCPFTFEYPDFGRITRDLSDSCWVDISFDQYGSTWHISYRNVDELGNSRSDLYEKYRGLIYHHSKKADQILETPFSNENGYGMLFEVYGNVGTPAQVFFSDSTGKKVIMNSFYYQTALKNDSLQPVSDFMKAELQHMFRSVEWE